jgi:uncharacterized protein involved in outer membrane biogenesis
MNIQAGSEGQSGGHMITMTKRKRHALIWLSSIFGIIAIITVAAGVFVATHDWNDAKKYISVAVNKTTGRKLVIDGDLKVDLGWTSRVRASQIQFENASWSRYPQMVEVGLVDAQIDLWQLLKGRFVLPAVNLSQVKVILEKIVKAQGTGTFPRPSPSRWYLSSGPTFPLLKNSS